MQAQVAAVVAQRVIIDVANEAHGECRVLNDTARLGRSVHKITRRAAVAADMRDNDHELAARANPAGFAHPHANELAECIRKAVSGWLNGLRVEQVAAARDRLDQPPVGIAEKLAQFVDALRERIVPHDDAGPSRSIEIILRYQMAGMHREVSQYLERLGAEIDDPVV